MSGLADHSPLLRVDNLSAGYGGMPVLHDVALDVYPAEMVALVGSNGAGKTTLLRALSRMLPCSGSIVMSGQELTGLTPDQVFGLGLVQVPEGRQLFDRMSVRDNLLMGSYRRKDKVAITRDLDKIYTLFPSLTERRNQLAGSLSGGEQQMCAMARALMAAPVAMMVDEMSLGLAPVVVEQLMEILTDIRGNGVTVLLVEQDVRMALSYADRAYVLETGHIVYQGHAKALIGDQNIQKAYWGL